MKILFITYYYPPYTFSEGMCNGKTVLALKEGGHEVDVISKWRSYQSYSDDWAAPWLELQNGLHEIEDRAYGKLHRAVDTVYSAVAMRSFSLRGIRWGRYAYDLALKLHREKRYDVIMTRALEDIPHVVGRRLAKRTGIPWIANWNDPTPTIWPGQYKLALNPLWAKCYDRFISSCMGEAACHTFPSRELMEHFQRHYPILRKTPCRVIPHNCLPEPLFPQPKRTEASGVFRMCHSGNLSKERDPKLLLQSMKRVMQDTGADMVLDIMGVSNDFADAVIEEEGMQKYVNFIGAYGYGEALKILGGYDVLLLLEAKLKEGIFFASKLTDYAQTGRPILSVSPADGFARRMLASCGGGEVVDNESPDSIDAGLAKLVRSWQAGRLEQEYTTSRLYAQWSSRTVLAAHEALFHELKPHMK